MGIFLPRSEVGLGNARSTRYTLIVSTLAEIEAATDLLSDEEKGALLRFLTMRLRRERALPEPRIDADDETSTMLAEDEADGMRLRAGAGVGSGSFPSKSVPLRKSGDEETRRRKATKWNFADKCVPKCNLGTREGPSDADGLSTVDSPSTALRSAQDDRRKSERGLPK